MSWYRVCRRLCTLKRASSVAPPQVSAIFVFSKLRFEVNGPGGFAVPLQLAVRGLRAGRLLLATEGEKKIAAILTDALQPTYLQVQDISGEEPGHVGEWAWQYTPLGL